MRVIIAGSRSLGYPELIKAISCYGNLTDITEVVSGCARGIDSAGEDWAYENRIPVKKFPANWENYGRAAGHIRNEEMGRYADALIAVWDGDSKGTKHMINFMLSLNKPVFAYIPYE